MTFVVAPSVKWVYSAGTGQQRPALCLVYGEATLCIQAGSEGAHLIVKPAKEFAGMRDVREDGALYPVRKATARLRGVGKTKGITASARLVLEAIESESVDALRDAELSNEEGNEIMRNDDFEFEDEEKDVGEEAPAKAPVKRAPPQKKKATGAAVVEKKETVKETTMNKTKNAKTKPAAKPAKAKATKKPAKAAKPVAKKAKAAATPGEGGFRAGSNMEKGFIAYKAARKEYQNFERGDKQVWAQKLADKLDTTLNSVRTMLSKNWEPLLAK